MASISSSELGKQTCPHCDSLLSKKALDTHRRLYFDTKSGTWMKKRCLGQPKPLCKFEEPSLEDFAFDDCNFNTPDVELPPPPIEFDQSRSYDLTLAGNFLAIAS